VIRLSLVTITVLCAGIILLLELMLNLGEGREVAEVTVARGVSVSGRWVKGLRVIIGLVESWLFVAPTI